MLRGVALVYDVEGAVGHGGCARGGGGAGGGVSAAPEGGFPCCGADVLDVGGVDAEAAAPEPFHFFGLGLVRAGEAEAAGEEADVIGAVDVGEAKGAVVERPVDGEFREDLLRGKFGAGDLEPGLQRRGFETAAGIDGGGGGGFVYHARSEFNEDGGGGEAGAMSGQGLGELGGADVVDGGILGVAGFAATIEDVGELPAGGEVEDLGEGLGAGSIGLEEVGGGACFREFGRKTRELGEDFVD